MKLMTPDGMKVEIDDRTRSARSFERKGDLATAWQLLEEAHVLSQPWPVPHSSVHIRMLGLAIRTHSTHEALGQVFRLALAGIGSATGRFPVGNSGRSGISAFEPMPIRDELDEILRRHLLDPTG